ncbi:hypothetical protein [Corynebacterium anserum]|uniref:Uncharacterized protein n=1 Tax=Corynebacterium anserum TaxID=2684406 RepID=A0A7G7YP81_9CORY|nr:hypothetical protein [Corynebacterium anserum]QNH96301.1 hypothetical protein GP473_06160 [Corynebacterium anserum]
MLNIRSITTSTPHPQASPLSALAPVRDSRRNAEQIKALLRHPRSRIRIAPNWKAPHVIVNMRSAQARIHASRHRVSPIMWEKLIGTPAPTDAPLFLVTLSAMVDEKSLRGPLRNVTVDIHSLFRSIVRNAWIQRDSEGESLTWTWHALLTQEQLEAEPLTTRPHAA